MNSNILFGDYLIGKMNYSSIVKNEKNSWGILL